MAKSGKKNGDKIQHEVTDMDSDAIETNESGETMEAVTDNPGAPGQAQLIVNGQYVKDLSFENPNVVRMMQMGNQQPEVTIDLGVNVQGVTEDSYEVTLQVRVETRREGLIGFIVELSYAGLFTLRGWAPEHVEPVLFVEGPKLLFPFARSIISNLTRDGGFPPLNLNPIDFTQLYRRRLAQQAAQAGTITSSAVN
jgi:preprotein translocase subunit SecB